MKPFFFIAAICIFIADAGYAATCGGLNPVVATATGLAFGNYNAGAASSDTANATITVACTVQLSNNLPDFTVAISAGNSGNFAAREMNFLTGVLKYNIYTSSAYTTVWGDGTAATSVQSYSASTGVASQNFTAYGSIPNHQYVAAGLYGDTLTVTVTY